MPRQPQTSDRRTVGSTNLTPEQQSVYVEHFGERYVTVAQRSIVLDELNRPTVAMNRKERRQARRGRR